MKVYLCADASGRYCSIRNATVEQIEDAGLEVVEDQSEDYEDSGDTAGTMTLLELKDSDAILF